LKTKLRIDEVAKDFGVTRRTVLRWIEKGEVETIKIGGTRRIFAASLENLQKKSDERCHPVTASDIAKP
jgi:excisionase family DNA binding protein